MKSFLQWLAEIALIEKQKRTCLGIYPPLYGVGQQPPLAQTPHSATAALALTTIHKKTVDELMGKSKSHKKKHGKHKKGHKKHKKGD
jgi:hypothetical protein